MIFLKSEVWIVK